MYTCRDDGISFLIFSRTLSVAAWISSYRIETPTIKIKREEKNEIGSRIIFFDLLLFSNFFFFDDIWFLFNTRFTRRVFWRVISKFMKKITKNVGIFRLPFVLTFIYLTREIYIEVYFFRKLYSIEIMWYTYLYGYASIWRDRNVSINVSKL